MAHINSHFFGWKLPDECAQKMKAYVDAGQRIRCVAFPPAGGNSWSVVTDKSFFNRGIPDECHEKMKEFHAAGHRVVCVAFPPAGGNSWSVVTDKSFFNRGIPDECHEKMKEFHAAGHRVVWVAFPPAGGNSWSVVTNKSFFNRGIPDECHTKMKEMHAAGQRVIRVAFPKAGVNRWSVLTEKGFFNRGVHPACHRVMRAFWRTGLGPLEVVGFYGADGFAIAARADAFTAAHPTLSDGGQVFSLDDFAQNLRDQLDGKGAKYGLMVRYGPAIRAATDGPKRTSTTPPEQDFTIFDWFNPASVTKTLSSVAVLQLLEAQSLGIDEPITKHLPSTWDVGDNVDTITVAELLNHTSGFRGGATKYDDLRDMVAAGIKLADKVDSYANCNTAMARIVAVYLDGHDESAADQSKATSEAFIALMQRNVFDKLGIPGVTWKADSDAPTLFFPTPPGTSTGTAYGDWTLKPGSAGAHVSIAELSTFVNTLATSNTLLPADRRQEMDDDGLGWGRGDDVNVGWYHRKRGYFPASKNGGAELNSGIWKFSTGVQAVILHNGPGGVDMAGAYDDAWGPA